MEGEPVHGSGPGPPDPGAGHAAMGVKPAAEQGHTECRGGTEQAGHEQEPRQEGAPDTGMAQTVTDETVGCSRVQERTDLLVEASSVGTWGDRVRTHAPNLDRITEEVARGSHMLEGSGIPCIKSSSLER